MSGTDPQLFFQIISNFRIIQMSKL